MEAIRYQQSCNFLLIQGKITPDELKKIANELEENLTDEEIQKIFAKANFDDDEFVN